MKPVTCIRTYRRARRNEYLAIHGDRIDTFIRNYIRFHFKVDFQHIANAYVRVQADADQRSWDYLDLREELHGALANQIVNALFGELCKMRWFDQRYLNVEQLADRCVSMFILEDWAAIS